MASVNAAVPDEVHHWVSDIAGDAGISKAAVVRGVLIAAMEAGTVLANSLAKQRQDEQGLVELSPEELGIAELGLSEAEQQEYVRFAHIFCSHTPRKRGWCERSENVLRLWAERAELPEIPPPHRRHPAALKALLAAVDEIGWEGVDWVMRHLDKLPWVRYYREQHGVLPPISKIFAGYHMDELVSMTLQAKAKRQGARRVVRDEGGVEYFDDGSVRAKWEVDDEAQ